MSDARDYVLAFESDKKEAQRIAESTAERLQSKQNTFIEIVQSVGEYINDEDDKIRGRAVSYLTAVLGALPPKYLSRQQIQVLCQFFCDRIEDGGAIDGLSRLQSLDRFNNEMAQTVVRAIFEHFMDLQVRPQSGRYRILQLLNELMSNHRKALRDMGDESLVGTVDLVSGEKDPRNLMLIFSVLHVIMVEWDISSHAEMMFDSVYVYFPITFRPPPNDPYGITAQDLKDRLRDCIASTKLLAPYAVSNLLEKLDSTSPVVKKDVLKALSSCASAYDAQTMSQYSIPLWDSLKFEVLSAQEPELAEETLVVLRDIAICLAGSANTSLSQLAQYLQPINKECIEHLQEPAQRQAKAAGDILKAVSSANAASFSLVTKAILAPMVTLYQSADSILKQRALLEITNQLLESAVSVFGTWRTPVSDASRGYENPLEQFKDKFLQIYSQAMMGTVKEEVSFRVTAAKGLLLLSKIRSFFDDSEIGMVVQHYDEIVLKEESYGRDDLKKTVMESLAEISKYKPGLVMDIAFPAFMARLPDTDAEAASAEDYQTTLEGLAEISVEKDVFETLVRRLLNKVDVLLQSENFHSPAYTCAILSTIYYIFNRQTLAGSANLESYYDRVVVGLTTRVVNSERQSALTALNHASALEILGRIINVVVRHSSRQNQSQACANVYNLFALTDGLQLLVSSEPGSPLANETILSTWLLAAIPREFQSPVLETANIRTTFTMLSKLLDTDTTHAVQLATLRQFALYINKHVPTPSLQIASDELSRSYQALSAAGKQDSQARTLTTHVRFIFTVSKALVLRLAPSTNKVLSDILSLLDPEQFSPEIGKIAASGFSTLLSPDDVLSKANFAQIRLLSPQRVFQTLNPLISAKFRISSNSSEKENYLTALSGILSTITSEIVMPEMPTLLPLLLQSLDLTDQAVKIATLETLAVVIATNSSVLEESGHIPALVKRLLKTATFPTATTTPNPRPQQQQQDQDSTTPNMPKTRRLALRCLFLMPTHVSGSASRTNPLLALKKEVLSGLAKVLDDPKRDVRKEGVDARGTWIRAVDDVKDADDSD